MDSSLPDFWDVRYRDGVTPWDAGRSPRVLRAFMQTLRPGARVLIPGCGAGYEVRELAELGFDALGIDFSAAAVEAAQRDLGAHAKRIRFADFFAFDAGAGFEAIYERAFLCALPRKMWPAYAHRMADLLETGGALAGFFFYGDKPRGPPFGTSAAELHGLLDGAFELIEDQPAIESLAVFEGAERWQTWRHR
ncbi:MAG: methyltransferase domain-containing protein [Betaproteobacteria bacterium]